MSRSAPYLAVAARLSDVPLDQLSASVAALASYEAAKRAALSVFAAEMVALSAARPEKAKPLALVYQAFERELQRIERDEARPAVGLKKKAVGEALPVPAPAPAPAQLTSRQRQRRARPISRRTTGWLG